MAVRGFRWLVPVVVVVAAGGVATTGAAQADVAQHRAITISSDADFTRPGAAAGCACVSSGSGTAASPYVIGPWAIAAPSGGSGGWAVKIDNSGGAVSKSFTITGISASYSGVPFTDPVIWLVDVRSSTMVANVSANGDGRGIQLDASADITIDSVSFNKMTGNALFLNGASDITLTRSKLKATADGQVPHNADGLFAVNSDHLRIGGVDPCPKNQVCNTFDYDTGWGVYLQNSQHVSIDHASANADDTGSYVLDNSSDVDLGHSTAQGDGPICITLGGSKTFTGYHTDLQGGLLVINGSHDNTIHDDRFAADVGYALGNGGNGFFANPCTSQSEPFTAEAPMGSGNTFTDVCYSSNDLGLAPNPCR